MHHYKRAILLLSLCLSFVFLAHGQEKHPASDLRGSIANENSYINPALGMAISLPGRWQELQTTTETPDASGCTGPLCGSPDINVVLESKPESKPSYKLFLSGWKLSTQYLNRNRYSLKWFADIMLEGSMDPNLVLLEKETAIRLDGKPAYRVLAGGSGEKTPRVLGYVTEGNGYVFLLVCAAPTNPQTMQSAIESLKFH